MNEKTHQCNSEKTLLLKNNKNCQSFKTLENQYITNKTLKFSDSINSIDSLRNENFQIAQKKSINLRKPIPAAPCKNSKNKLFPSKGKFPNYSVASSGNYRMDLETKNKLKNINTSSVDSKLNTIDEIYSQRIVKTSKNSNIGKIGLNYGNIINHEKKNHVIKDNNNFSKEKNNEQLRKSMKKDTDISQSKDKNLQTLHSLIKNQNFKNSSKINSSNELIKNNFNTLNSAFKQRSNSKKMFDSFNEDEVNNTITNDKKHLRTKEFLINGFSNNNKNSFIVPQNFSKSTEQGSSDSRNSKKNQIFQSSIKIYNRINSKLKIPSDNEGSLERENKGYLQTDVNEMKENYNKLKKETNKKENFDFKKYNLFQLSNYVDNYNKSNINTSKSPKMFEDEESLFKKKENDNKFTNKENEEKEKKVFNKMLNPNRIKNKIMVNNFSVNEIKNSTLKKSPNPSIYSSEINSKNSNKNDIISVNSIKSSEYNNLKASMEKNYSVKEEVKKIINAKFHNENYDTKMLNKHNAVQSNKKLAFYDNRTILNGKNNSNNLLQATFNSKEKININKDIFKSNEKLNFNELKNSKNSNSKDKKLNNNYNSIERKNSNSKQKSEKNKIIINLKQSNIKKFSETISPIGKSSFQDENYENNLLNSYAKENNLNELKFLHNNEINSLNEKHLKEDLDKKKIVENENKKNQKNIKSPESFIIKRKVSDNSNYNNPKNRKHNEGKINKNSALKKSFEKTIHINHNYSHNILINIENRNPLLKKSLTKDYLDSKKYSDNRNSIKKTENNNNDIESSDILNDFLNTQNPEESNNTPLKNIIESICSYKESKINKDIKKNLSFKDKINPDNKEEDNNNNTLMNYSIEKNNMNLNNSLNNKDINLSQNNNTQNPIKNNPIYFSKEKQKTINGIKLNKNELKNLINIKKKLNLNSINQNTEELKVNKKENILNNIDHLQDLVNSNPMSTSIERDIHTSKTNKTDSSNNKCSEIKPLSPFIHEKFDEINTYKKVENKGNEEKVLMENLITKSKARQEKENKFHKINNLHMSQKIQNNLGMNSNFKIANQFSELTSRKSEKNNEKISEFIDNKAKMDNYSSFLNKNSSQIFEKIEKNKAKLNLQELNSKIDKLQNKKQIIETKSNNDNNAKNYEDDSLENKKSSMKTSKNLNRNLLKIS